MHKIKINEKIYKVIQDNGHLLWCNAHSVLINYNGKPTEVRMVDKTWELVGGISHDPQR